MTKKAIRSFYLFFHSLIDLGYVWVNRDKLKTQQKCQKLAEESLATGKSVVIDNTNPDPATRKAYVDIAKRLSVPVRCFLVTTPRPLAEHLNMFRVVRSGGEVGKIPDIAYNVYMVGFLFFMFTPLLLFSSQFISSHLTSLLSALYYLFANPYL